MTDKSNTTEADLPRKSRFAQPYMVIWAVLTALSIMYLALLATNPQLVASALGAKAHDAEQQQANAMIATELERLRGDIAKLSTDFQTLRTDVTTQGDRERDLLERVAALEAPQAPADPQKVAALAPAQKPAAQPAKPQKLPGQLQQPAAAAPPGAPAPAAPQAPAVAQAKAPAKKAPAAPAQQAAQAPAAPPVPQQTAGLATDQLSLETGSVGADAPVSFGPATVTPAQPAAAPATTVATAAPTAAAQQPKAVGIQIASGPSVQSLRLSWTLLSERHGASLSRYQPRYTVGATEQGVTYDLVVGPFANANDARAVCAELAASATPCSLQAFRGDAL